MKATLKDGPAAGQASSEDGRPASASEHIAGSETGGRTLASIIDGWIGLAFVVAMAVCAGVEYARNPGIGFGELFFHHLFELFLFGLILWGISWLVLRVVLVEPIHRIFQHLYGVGGGDHSPLVVKTGVREIREIVDAINIMLWRMDQRADGKVLNRAREQLAGVRDSLSGETALEIGNVEEILDELADLDHKLYQAAQTGALLRRCSGRQAR